MATVVIGGQASGVGKTSVICGLLRALPERRWTAIKITQCDHDAGRGCHCRLGSQAFAIDEESDAQAQTDTSKFMKAGAARSLWVRVRPGALGDAVRQLRPAMDAAQDVIFESNAVLEFVRPNFYGLVVSPQIEDFKQSARRWLSRAHALVITHPHGDGMVDEVAWLLKLDKKICRIPQFEMRQSELLSPALMEFVRGKMKE